MNGMKRAEFTGSSETNLLFWLQNTLNASVSFYVSMVLIGSLHTRGLLNGPGKTELNVSKYLSLLSQFQRHAVKVIVKRS